jgi:Family of unknown function (DUF6922)
MKSLADINFSLPKYAFWDVDLDKLDMLKDKNFIISRMFERGKLDDVFSIITFYGIKDKSKFYCLLA